MAKAIIKELIIVLLLCLAIILLLGVLLYEYVPMSKTVPNPVSYTTPEDLQQELAASSDVDNSQIILTYEVDSTDLNNYERINDYQPGKANPFSSYETSGENTTTNGSATGGNSTSSGSNSSSSNNSNTSSSGNTTTSGGEYFQDKGTK